MKDLTGDLWYIVLSYLYTSCRFYPKTITFSIPNFIVFQELIYNQISYISGKSIRPHKLSILYYLQSPLKVYLGLTRDLVVNFSSLRQLLSYPLIQQQLSYLYQNYQKKSYLNYQKKSPVVLFWTYFLYQISWMFQKTNLRVVQRHVQGLETCQEYFQDQKNYPVSYLLEQVLQQAWNYSN